jgi:hypothetical protein
MQRSMPETRKSDLTAALASIDFAIGADYGRYFDRSR